MRVAKSAPRTTLAEIDTSKLEKKRLRTTGLRQVFQSTFLASRHCPKCQARNARAWLEARQADLLPVQYYHVVFTLPAPISAIAYHSKALLYGLLFDVAAETLRTIAADPKHLGAQIGASLVRHTWGSALTHHPHVHGIVPGGGLSVDNGRWVRCKPGLFLSVRVLSRLFRHRFLLHVLPSGFHRIRHFGLIANAGHRGNLARAPELLDVEPETVAASAADTESSALSAPTYVCGAPMSIIEVFRRAGSSPRQWPTAVSSLGACATHTRKPPVRLHSSVPSTGVTQPLPAGPVRACSGDFP